MPLPPDVEKRIRERFDDLAEDAKDFWHLELDAGDAGWHGWCFNAASLLSQIMPANHPHQAFIKSLTDVGFPIDSVKDVKSHVRRFLAIRHDFELGLLGDIGAQIESEIASDYMGQAERLMGEGQSGQFDHVPAAVLAGAVLEKTLRSMCERRGIAIVDANGRPLMMDTFITELKKADAFKEAYAHQLRAWAQVRNKAAHGEFDKFDRQQVQAMVDGVRHFIATYAV